MIEIIRRAAVCRAFEEEVFSRVKSGEIKIPVYLSSGQEYVAATLSVLLEKHNPAVFIQHRNHAQYLCFGGSIEHLVNELNGGDTGMQGSASIGEGSIFGHDGMMGSQVPIAVGYCHATKRQTICFMGDASAEEDYTLSALGWSATKRLPILFVVEDNNLAILTQKRVRRTWDIAEVATAFGIESYNVTDAPSALSKAVDGVFLAPRLLNVETSRLYWHAGAGQDNPLQFDRHKEIGVTDFDLEAKEIVGKAWN